VTGRPTGFDHVGLVCADLDRSVAFYVDALGLEPRGRGVAHVQAADTVGDRFAYADVALPDGRIIELLQFLDQEPAPTGGGHFALGTTDVTATLARLAEVGVQPLGPPAVLTEAGDWEGVTIVFVRDPDGHRVEFVQRPSGGVGIAATADERP
jgi:glyoxylase I family protein